MTDPIPYKPPRLAGDGSEKMTDPRPAAIELNPKALDAALSAYRTNSDDSQPVTSGVKAAIVAYLATDPKCQNAQAWKSEYDEANRRRDWDYNREQVIAHALMFYITRAERKKDHKEIEKMVQDIRMGMWQ